MKNKFQSFVGVMLGGCRLSDTLTTHLSPTNHPLKHSGWKYIFTIMLLLTMGIGQVWAADPDLTVNGTSAASAAWVGSYNEGAITIAADVSGSNSSYSSGYYGLGNNGNYNTNYVEVLATTVIDSVSFLVSSNGDNKASKPNLLGWEGTTVPSQAVADFFEEQSGTLSSGYSNAQWFKFKLNAKSINRVRIYRHVNATTVGEESCVGTSTQTIRIFGVKVWLHPSSGGGSSDPVDPTITFNNGNYTVGGSALDLSTLFTSNSAGTVTYSIKDANGTGAALAADGKSFSATAGGTATVKASQAEETGKYNAKEVTATITVYAEKAGIKMIENGALTGKFRIKNSQLKTGNYTVEGIAYTKYVQTSSALSSFSSETEGTQVKGIYFVPTKKNIRLWFYARNTDTSNRKIYVYTAEEGASSITSTNVSVTSGSSELKYIDISLNKNAEIVIGVENNKLLLCQIVAAESGDALLQGGEVGYVFDYTKKRQNIAANTLRTIDGIDYKLSAESKINSGTNVQLQTLGTHYIKFHLDARTKVKLTIDGTGKQYYIGTECSTEAAAQKYSGTATAEFNLAQGDWYINGGGVQLKIQKIEFLTPDAVYAVTYAAGTGSVKSGKSLPTHDDAMKDEKITLASGENLEKSGYDFTGWKANGTGDLLQPGDEYTMTAAAVEFVAQWALHVAKYGVKFMDGETKLDSLAVKVGEAPVFANPTKALYTFAGWKDGDNNEVTLSDLATSVTVEDTKLVLYAQWNKAFAQNIDVEDYAYNTGTNKTAFLAWLTNKGYNYDNLNALDNTTSNNGAYAGMKANSKDAYYEFRVAADKRVTIKLGYMASAAKMYINEVENTTQALTGGSTSSGNANYAEWTYDVTAESIFKLQMNTTSTCVLKGITIGEIPAKSDVATLSDLTLKYGEAAAATISGFSASKYIYNVDVPYGTAKADLPIAGATATDATNALVSINQAKDREDWKTVIRVQAEDRIDDHDKYYEVRFNVAPKYGVELIKATHNGTASGATVTGYIGGTVDKLTQNGGKLGSDDPHHYFGIQLASGKFQAGDMLVIKASALNGGNAATLYSDKGVTAISTNGSFDATTKMYIYTLTAETEKIYLYRQSSACNPNVEYMAVYRYMAPFIEEFKIGDAVGTFSEENNVKKIAVEVPYNVALTSLTPSVKAWANGGASVSPTTAQNFSVGAINYTVSGAYAEDATGDYAPVTYEVTVSNAAHYVAQIGETKYTTLDEAVTYANANAGSEIVLLEDITRDERITLTADATINLAGYTLGKTNGGWLIFVKGGATLTIDGTTANSAVYGGISLGAASNNNGSLVLNGGAYSCGENTACIHINGTCLNSDVTINGATITNAYDNAIQFNGKGTFTITDATITGATGIYIKSGEMTITNSTVTGTMAPANYSYYGNGANATGDGIVVDACNYPGGAPTVNIVSGTFSGTKSAIGNYNYQGTSEPAVGGITGGTFSTAVPAELCAPDYTPTSWTVGTETKYGVQFAGVIREAAAQVAAYSNAYAVTLDNGVVMISADSDGKFTTSTQFDTSAADAAVELGADEGKYRYKGQHMLLKFPVNVSEFTIYSYDNNTTDRKINKVTVGGNPATDKLKNNDAVGTYTFTNNTTTKLRTMTATMGDDVIAAGDYVYVGLSNAHTVFRVLFTEAECTTPVINETNVISAKVGENATLTVDAAAIGATYKWYRCEDEQGANPQLIEGATASKYVFEKAAGTEYFKVVVGCNCSEEMAEAIIAVEEWVAIERTNVTGYTEWSWDGVFDGDGETIYESTKGLVLASYINAPNFDKLEGVNGARVYRSNTYKAYQGTSLKFTTEVPGMLILDASCTNSGNKIAVNGHDLGTLPSNHAPNFKIAVASGDVTITSEGMRIWAMKFDPNFANYALADNALNGYTREVNAGRYGTICLPYNGVMVGAALYEVAYFDAAKEKIFFDEIINGEMVGGTPYIFLPNEGVSELGVFYTGTDSIAAGNANGLYGSYKTEVLDKDAGNYILQNNQYRYVGSGSTNVKVGAYRAYIKLGEIQTNEVAPAPGRRRIEMGVVGEQVATGMENVQGDNVQTTKVLIDGQMFILRGEKMYDATGKLVK